MKNKKAKIINNADLKFSAISGNEGFARGAVTAFLMFQDPTIADLSDIKTALSEAVTNAIIHAYREKTGDVYINMKVFDDGNFIIKVRDKGCGIADIEQAMEPLFTTGGEEQAGIGFAVMESFCDKIKVSSKLGKGTTVTLWKQMSKKDE